MVATRTSIPPEAHAVRPSWVPENVDFETLPVSVQKAFLEIVDPVYRTLVLEELDPLARASGLSFAHLAWLEIIEQHELGEAMAELLPSGKGAFTHQERISRHVRLVMAKDGVGKTILRARKYRQLRDPRLEAGLGGKESRNL
jgi:hypothetical protein